MYSVNILLARLFAVESVLAIAIPLQLSVQAPLDMVECERVEKYTTEWFLANTRPEYAGNLMNTALFYSQGMSTTARRYARVPNNNMTTIWDVWPCYLYNHHQDRSNPMRCIHRDERDRLLLFENMSRAFALKARNFSTVMHSSQNFRNPPRGGIWGRVEFSALRESGNINSLEKINENRTLHEICWEKPAKLWEEFNFQQKWTSLFSLMVSNRRKRSANTLTAWHDSDAQFEPSPSNCEHCLSDKELQYFDDVAW